MREITVETDFGNRLGEVTGQALLCDADGRALGFFSPLPDRPHKEDLQLEPPLSVSATEELRKVRTGKPLDEILARLGVQ
jgi:hypothetical protein